MEERNSIFDLADKFGYVSPFGDWLPPKEPSIYNLGIFNQEVSEGKDIAYVDILDLKVEDISKYEVKIKVSAKGAQEMIFIASFAEKISNRDLLRFETTITVTVGADNHLEALLIKHDTNRIIDRRKKIYSLTKGGRDPYAGKAPIHQSQTIYSGAFGIIFVYGVPPQLTLINYIPFGFDKIIFPKIKNYEGSDRKEELLLEQIGFIKDAFIALDYIYVNGNYSNTILKEYYKNIILKPIVFDAKTMIDIIVDKKNANKPFRKIVSENEGNLPHLFNDELDGAVLLEPPEINARDKEKHYIQVNRFVIIVHNKTKVDTRFSIGLDKLLRIPWNPRLGTNFITRDGDLIISGKQSPALVLFHELAHFFGHSYEDSALEKEIIEDFKNKNTIEQNKWSMWEESYVIQYYENMIAQNIESQEDIRMTHEALFYTTKGPTSIEPLDPSEVFLTPQK